MDRETLDMILERLEAARVEARQMARGGLTPAGKARQEGRAAGLAQAIAVIREGIPADPA